MNIALVGNQNSGKSSLFNILCQAKEKTGNWPGVTIDKKEGQLKNSSHYLIDLPGTYSLIPYTIEEEITCNYLKKEKIDLIINVIDATLLERSLYLTLQLLEGDIPVVVVLNMADLLEKENIILNIKELEEELGIPVLKISCVNNLGIKELNEIINKRNVNKIKFVNQELSEKAIELRYQRIEKILAKSLVKQESKAKNIDKLLLNKYWGIPLFIMIMGLIYFLSLNTLGAKISSLLSDAIDYLKTLTQIRLTGIGVSPWLISLISDGVLSGMGAVLVFIPQLLILFFLMGLLERSGYLNRISLLLDHIFKKLGLNGKSAISFILGTGCSVPGILSTRSIENKDERELTISLISFIPCSAKLPIIILITSAFFPYNQTLMAISLYVFSILIIILFALIGKKRRTDNIFISELPKLQLPNLKNTIKDTLDKVLDFIKRVGTVILFSSIIIWCLAHLTPSLTFTYDISNSLLRSIGSIIAPLFYPFINANSWEASISLLQGLIAKEQVVASMKILSQEEYVFNSEAFSFFTPLTAFSFCVFNLFSAPCISAISTIFRELNNKKKAIKIITMQILFAYILSTLLTFFGGLIL